MGIQYFRRNFIVTPPFPRLVRPGSFVSALVPLPRPWYTGRERGDFVTKPNFEDFQDFLEAHQKELFQQLQRMDVLQVDSPITQEGLSLLLQTVQDNAIRYTQGYTQLSLYAYHTWLMEQLGLEDQGPA